MTAFLSWLDHDPAECERSIEVGTGAGLTPLSRPSSFLTEQDVQWW